MASFCPMIYYRDAQREKHEHVMYVRTCIDSGDIRGKISASANSSTGWLMMMMIMMMMTMVMMMSDDTKIMSMCLERPYSGVNSRWVWRCFVGEISPVPSLNRGSIDALIANHGMFFDNFYIITRRNEGDLYRLSLSGRVNTRRIQLWRHDTALKV